MKVWAGGAPWSKFEPWTKNGQWRNFVEGQSKVPLHDTDWAKSEWPKQPVALEPFPVLQQ